jgi:hypothetical protein
MAESFSGLVQVGEIKTGRIRPIAFQKPKKYSIGPRIRRNPLLGQSAAKLESEKIPRKLVANSVKYLPTAQ